MYVNLQSLHCDQLKEVSLNDFIQQSCLYIQELSYLHDLQLSAKHLLAHSLTICACLPLRFTHTLFHSILPTPFKGSLLPFQTMPAPRLQRLG